MELVEIKCANCLKEIYVQKEFIRKEMFCTLGCMDLYLKTSGSNSGIVKSKKKGF